MGRLIDASMLKEKLLSAEIKRKGALSVTEVYNVIDNTPTCTVAWIPVSERLPEAAELESCGDEVTPVLITYLGYYDREPHEGGLVIWCEDNTWRWHDETLDVNMMDVVKVEITAWMPLPEPYRP